MSYDIYLTDPVSRDPIELEEAHYMRGGTYALSGTTRTWLNITYNYANWYYRPGVFGETAKNEGIRTIYGLSGAESIPVLKKAIAALESLTVDISEEDRRNCEKQGTTGYWIPTRANAIRPLYQLLALAQMRPDGTWEGD